MRKNFLFIATHNKVDRSRYTLHISLSILEQEKSLITSVFVSSSLVKNDALGISSLYDDLTYSFYLTWKKCLNLISYLFLYKNLVKTINCSLFKLTN